MSAILSAFISCTDKDLRAHRAAVRNALIGAQVLPVSMEDFPAESEIPLKVCQKRVAQAHLFIGIYAWRYGFIPKGSEISITEHELRKAEELERPCLFFVVDEGHPWPDEHREGGKAAELLQSLKNRIRAGSVVKPFTTPEDLALKVIQAIHPHLQMALRPQALRLLLEAVETSSERFLEKTAPETRRIVLEMKEASGADLQEEPAALLSSSEEAVLELFEKRQRKLLILGEAGSGKTTTLQLLAHGLAGVAREDSEAPVPVVLNLASWGERPQSLEQWLAEEMAASHGTGTEAALEWVRGDKILPLLDGLDEVRTDDKVQAACAEAINAHFHEHGLFGFAVCCRTQAYRDLGVPLQLATALVLQPLTSGQVDDHLSAAGGLGEDLQGVLSEDPGLRALAESPQLLSLMEKICRDGGVEALTGPPGAPLAERQRRLFRNYVDLSLKRRPPHPYTPERMISPLVWLAQRMKERSLPQFRLEQLQPNWLATRGERWTYALASRSLAGGLLALPAALGLRSALALAFGLFAGALAGAVDAVGLRRSLAAGLPYGVRQGLLRSAVHVAGYGAGAFFLFYLAAVRVDQTPYDAILGGLLFALLFGVVLGLRSAQRDGSNDVRVAEALTWQGWSLRGARRGALSGAILLLIVGGLQLLASGSLDVPALAVIGVSFVLAGALGGGLLGGVGVRIISKKVQPNEGIWRTLRNTGLLMLAAALASSLMSVVFAVLVWSGYSFFERFLLWSLPWGAMLGFWIGLWFSGLDFLHHFILRGLLRLRGYAPARYVSFLDAADRSGLLHRERGSYAFLYGPSLLDHFATLPSPADEAR